MDAWRRCLRDAVTAPMGDLDGAQARWAGTGCHVGHHVRLEVHDEDIGDVPLSRYQVTISILWPTGIATYLDEKP